MNLRLIVMRHAKSDWGSPELSDHERPLNERGRRDAPRIAHRLIELGWTPDYVASSDAVRTRETWELMEPLFTGQSSKSIDVEFRNSMYLAGRNELSHVLSGLADRCPCALALGHNPGWEEAASWFAGQPLHMTTANAVLLSITATDWATAVAQRGEWQLVDHLRPKELN